MIFTRISTLIVAFLTATSSSSVFEPKESSNSPKSAYMNKIVTRAKVLRELDQAVDPDLTSYTILFQKCQHIKVYNAELAAEGAETVLTTQRFVIFRLCPTASSTCNYDFGEYLLDMNAFLQYTVEYRQEEQEQMCEACDQNCAYEENENGNDRKNRRRLAAQNRFSRKLAVDCDTCTETCEEIENMEENNYIDATNYLDCEQIIDDGDDQVALYAGPTCSSQGSRIKISVFSDEDCTFLEDDLDVEDYLVDENGYTFKLSYELLETTYDNTDPIQCEQIDEYAEADGEHNYYAAAAETREVCLDIYNYAAKCEKSHGFEHGVKSYYAAYENQIDNEEQVCDFVSAIKYGTYRQDGEIVIDGTSSYSSLGAPTTGGQKVALSFFILGTVGLTIYAAILHFLLNRGPTPILSSQGGTMA